MADSKYVLELTDANFDEVIDDSENLIVVDFWPINMKV